MAPLMALPLLFAVANFESKPRERGQLRVGGRVSVRVNVRVGGRVSVNMGK